jgi:hypothetical protein
MNTEPSLNVDARVSQRRSRMRRTASFKRVHITDRDIEVLRLLSRYRYLRSSYLHALVGGKSHKRFIERLGHLYHEGGYIDRPRQQWQAINARYMPAVYELGDAGERMLIEQGVLGQLKTPLVRKGRQGAVRQFQHDLMICDILASVEIGVSGNRKLRYVSWQEILANSKTPEATRTAANPFAIPASITYTCPRTHAIERWDKPLIPDALFGIEYLHDGRKTYRFFAVEADRNSEPIVRGNLQQTSYLRKILQYREISARKTYLTHFGLPNLLVLNVTINEQHMRNLVRSVGEFTEGKGSAHFLFMTMPSLASLEKAPPPTPHILTAPWERAGHSEFRLDQP